MPAGCHGLGSVRDKRSGGGSAVVRDSCDGSFRVEGVHDHRAFRVSLAEAVEVKAPAVSFLLPQNRV